MEAIDPTLLLAAGMVVYIAIILFGQAVYNRAVEQHQKGKQAHHDQASRD